MNSSSLGKIYMIKSIEGNNCYIGKTTKNYISMRIAQHTYDFRNQERRPRCSSFEVLKYSDYTYELLEDNIANDQIKARENFYINHYENTTNINSKIKIL
jgi:hypothetical protein